MERPLWRVATNYAVAGSVGPSGELIEPVGPLSMAEAEAIFAEQMQGLLEGGVDLILVETMSHLNEVVAAVKAARKVAPNIPVATTMSFDTNPGRRSYDTTTYGIFARRAAHVAGKLPYPPRFTATLGCRSRRTRFAARTAPTSFHGSSRLRTTLRGERLRCNPTTSRNVWGKPVGGTRRVSTPRWVPM